MTIYQPEYLADKGYTSANDRELIQTLAGSQEGVGSLVTDLIVSPGGALTVSVSAGRAIVAGDFAPATQGYYHFYSDSAVTVALATADATNPRLDQIVARVYDSTDGGNGSDTATIEVVTGTATSGATLANRNGAAALPNQALPLADVLVTAGLGTIAAANIGDKRTTFGVSHGSAHIDGGESTSATTYALTNLATPDVVRNIVIPTDGVITVLYQALWQNAQASNGRAAIFVGANQLKKVPTGGGTPAVDESTGSATINVDAALHTSPNGLARAGGASATTEVTTGQLVGSDTVGLGGPLYIFGLPAGTYDISVQYKNSGAGTLTAKKRHLWVWVRTP